MYILSLRLPFKQKTPIMQPANAATAPYQETTLSAFASLRETLSPNTPPTAYPIRNIKNTKNVHFLKFAHEKKPTRLEKLRLQLLAHQELIANDGCLAATWKTYRGKRLGPYYRVEFRQDRAVKTIYLGRDPLLVEYAAALIDDIKKPNRQKRYLRRLRAEIRASLRRSFAEAEQFVAPFGYHRRGLSFRKIRTDQKSKVGQATAQSHQFQLSRKEKSPPP
jgi:hypothetical protein